MDPTDIGRVVLDVFQKSSMRPFLQKSKVSAQRLLVVRDWQAWHKHLKVEMQGGLLVDATAAHFFLFMKRNRLCPRCCILWCEEVICYICAPHAPKRLGSKHPCCRIVVSRDFVRAFGEDVPAPRWLPRPEPNDIVCAVKRFVSDRAFSQEPVVVMPQAGINRLPGQVPTSRVARVFSPEKVDHWKKLLSVVEGLASTQPTYWRAVSYVTELAEGTSDRDAELEELVWHSSPPAPQVEPITLPMGLQGPLAPQMRFVARWQP